MAEVIDLIGPKGYTHGWVYHGPGRATATHTRRLARADVGRASKSLASMGPSERADSYTRALTGRKASDYQHLAAAWLHSKAASLASSPSLVAHHEQMARMHRGIAARTVGRGVRSEGPLRSSRGGTRSRLPRPPAGMDTANMRLAIRAGLLAADNRLGRPDRQTIQAANLQAAVELADGPEPYTRGPDENVKCPACDKYNAPDARYCDQCGAKLPDSAYVNLSNPYVELAMPTTQPIRTPSDLLISRGEGGVAIIRHRMGGAEIGTIRRDGRGWRASVGGRDLDQRNHQRTALADVIGTHNRGALTPEHRPSAGSALQPPAQQTPLMAQYGIPAIRALATPSYGSDDGPRAAGSDSGSDDNGLNAKGQQIYKKLKARGFPEARAMAFAKRAQNMGSS